MKDFLKSISIFVIAGIFIFGTSFFVRKLREPEVIEKEKTIVEKQLIKAPDCSKDFEGYKQLVEKGQSVKILSSTPMFATNGQLINAKTISTIRTGKDEIACGYLYIKTRVDGKGLDDKYDSIYINPQGFGGHLLRTKGISIPNTNPSAITETLLPLGEISYLPKSPYNPNATDYRIADWVKLLNVSNYLDFQIGLSTLDQRGVVEEVSLAYKCWDKNTGDETANCQLGTK